MTYAEFFSEIKGRFMEADVSGIREHLAYQFNITGEAEGIFYIEVKEGKLYVEPYEYYDRGCNVYLQRTDTSQDCRWRNGSDSGGHSSEA